MHDLVQLAGLIRQSNIISDQIAALIKRPAEMGHIGEYIASKIFNIKLLESASHKSIDGHFVDGPLAGRSVNIKWYGKREGLLDIAPTTLPDFYLVLAGPKSSAASSRNTTRPKIINFVFLFETTELVRKLTTRKVKIGIATSITQQVWSEAEIYPVQRNTKLCCPKNNVLHLRCFSSFHHCSDR